MFGWFEAALKRPPFQLAREGNTMKIGGVLSLALMLSVLAIPAGAQNKVLHGYGRVTAVAADSFTLQSGSATMTFAVDSATKVEGKGVGTKTRAMKADKKSPQLTDLVNASDAVQVEY